MPDPDLEAAFSKTPAASDASFTRAIEKRLALRRKQRTALFFAIGIAAIVCFAALLFGLSQLALAAIA